MPGRRSESVRERAVLALLTFPNLKTAARKAGVGVRTLKRWLAEPDFKADYAEARRRYLEAALGRLQRASGKAVSRLIQLVGSADSKVAVRAALGLLDRSIKAAETMDILLRLEQLEAAAKQGGRNHAYQRPIG
jgi:hypothetical protein